MGTKESISTPRTSAPPHRARRVTPRIRRLHTRAARRVFFCHLLRLAFCFIAQCRLSPSTYSRCVQCRLLIRHAACAFDLYLVAPSVLFAITSSRCAYYRHLLPIICAALTSLPSYRPTLWLRLHAGVRRILAFAQHVVRPHLLQFCLHRREPLQHTDFGFDPTVVVL